MLSTLLINIFNFDIDFIDFKIDYIDFYDFNFNIFEFLVFVCQKTKFVL
jgi:hypothetical protein